MFSWNDYWREKWICYSQALFCLWSFAAIHLSTAISSVKTELILGPDGVSQSSYPHFKSLMQSFHISLCLDRSFTAHIFFLPEISQNCLFPNILLIYWSQLNPDWPFFFFFNHSKSQKRIYKDYFFFFFQYLACHWGSQTRQLRVLT